jgi:D-alanine-D-alanine ligase
MSRTVVGILRGGPTSEYDLSLKSGSALLNALPEDGYDARDIFVDKTGVWHMRGMPTDPARTLSQIDTVINAIHGGVGEDGTVQRILGRAGVGYAGSRAMASALSLNKIRARDAFRSAGIQIPNGVSFSLQDDMNTADMARQVFDQFGPPYVVKAPSEGTSHGIGIAHTIVDLPDLIADILDAYGAALVEEYIIGHDATVGIVENFRNEELYAFPPAHVVVPKGNKIIQSQHHRGDEMIVSVPSSFSHDDKNRLIEAAREAHRALGMQHFSRADFRLTRRGPYLLEVNSTPKLYEGAVLPKMLESVGSSVREFAEHAINLSRTAV